MRFGEAYPCCGNKRAALLREQRPAGPREQPLRGSTMRATSVSLAVLTLVLMIAGCNGDGDTPTSPTRPIVPSSSFVGTWSGSIVDAEIGGGTLRLTIVEHIDRSLFGSWASTFPDAARNDGGSVSGFLNATSSAAFFTLSSASVRTCPTPLAAATLAANLTVIGDRMAGEFTSLGCTTVRAGTMELTKQ